MTLFSSCPETARAADLNARLAQLYGAPVSAQQDPVGLLLDSAALVRSRRQGTQTDSSGSGRPNASRPRSSS